MFTIKHKFPKDFEKYPERCQSYYIHNIMSYGLHFEPEPIFWKLSEDVQLSYIAEILSTKKHMIIRQNKLFYKKFENEFTINNDVLRIITNFNNYYWNMNNQTEVLDFYLDFTKKYNNNIIYQTIHTFISVLDNINSHLPNELWYLIFQYMNYYNILSLRLNMREYFYDLIKAPS